MATYYVRKDGNDTTGDGSTGAPWLTIVKAVATLPATADQTVKIGPGVYQESYSGLGYLYLNRNPNAGFWWTFEAENPADKPVIQPGGTPLYMVRIGTSSARWILRNLVFDWNEVSMAGGVFSITAGTTISDITFDACEFIWGDGAVYAISAVMTGATKSLARVTVQNCAFTFEGADADGSAYAMRFTLSTGISISDVTIRGCTCSMPGFPLWLDGVSNFLVENCNFSSSVKMGLMIGGDGAATAGANSGTVSGGSISAAVSHAFLIGWLSDGVTVQGCKVQGGNQGVVVKACTNVLVTGCTIIGGAAADYSLLFKGATNSQAINNDISGTYSLSGAVVGLEVNSTTKCENITLTYNKIRGSGSTRLLLWGNDTHDAGGGVCDYNRYQPNGTNKFGNVRDTLGITTLAGLRAAWAGYGDGSNDSHSTLWGDDDLLLLFARRRK